jgi:hypothetical protein
MAETGVKGAKKPTWKDAKLRLESFDRQGLLQLIQHLYNADQGNQAFIHKRLDLGGDSLESFKKKIENSLFPNGVGRDPSVPMAKQAISHYRKTVGVGPGLAELTVFYCEVATDFGNRSGYEMPSYYDALSTMFEQALKVVVTLPAADQQPFVERLRSLQRTVEFGYGVDSYMDWLLRKYIAQ